MPWWAKALLWLIGIGATFYLVFVIASFLAFGAFTKMIIDEGKDINKDFQHRERLISPSEHHSYVHREYHWSIKVASPRDEEKASTKDEED